ncbi:MAG TPA: hypothetical protein DD381_03470 [Lentisphaeria bacterium]|nr:MAG: hypothetical protein A2X47_02780 [Lentisphaerae bacterium GWF2_38_69]HBM15392.1 hypothetical protein [Lentisphaeria bacterium]
MKDSRYIIGIDLGTTNIAVTFVDLKSENKTINLFKVPQLVAPGEIDELALFPSFCFFFDENLNKKEHMNPSWNSENFYTVGAYARDFGATIPNRFISSAKSWLCHSGVERREKILPWGGNIQEVMHSPLKVSSYYIDYIKNAWNHKYGNHKDSHGNPCVFEEQNVVLTIPASFDETARGLTIEAAKLSGCRHISLIEEPLAAFYSWLDINMASWQDNIAIGEKVLVIDVGGGTTDFSIIELNENGSLERTAAGNHLLLGGDNIDIAIARKIEEHWNKKLPNADWLTLCQKTRQAKEVLLNDLNLKSTDITLLSQGSSVIGNHKKYILKRSELEELLIEGFFPVINSDAPSPQRKKGIQKMGLPYETDPSVSAHLLHFLKYAQSISCNPTKDSDALFPDKVLFNGGTMIPKILRERIIRCIEGWFKDRKIEEFASRDLSLAVAFGASYFGRTKSYGGIKVKTASTRSYYLKVAEDSDKKNLAKVLCIMPRGSEENKLIRTPGEFLVETNRTVHFPLLSSSTRTKDKEGDFISDNEELSSVSSLFSMLKYGKNHEKTAIKVSIAAELTESGVLKIELDSETTSHKWPLKFDVRLISDEEQAPDSSKAITFETDIYDNANAVIKSYFDSKQTHKNLLKELEKITASSKDKWPIHFLRHLADTLLAIDYKTLKQPVIESKWLNLCGFSLRPGFGDPEDEIRLRKVWQMWQENPNNPNDTQTISEWWVFWRRIMPGFKSGHQLSMYQELSKELFPKNIYQQRIKLGEQPKAEMYKCLGALELLSEKQKKIIGNILIQRANKLQPYEYWVLSRLGSRKLFHAPTNAVLHTDTVEKWVLELLDDQSNRCSEKLFAVSRMASLTPDRALNLSSQTVHKAISFLKDSKAPTHWIKHLESVIEDDTQEQAKLLGDSIPFGLSIG